MCGNCRLVHCECWRAVASLVVTGSLVTVYVCEVLALLTRSWARVMG